MKVLLINGSPKVSGCTYTALSEVAKELQHENIETEIFHVGNMAIRGCMACFKCFGNRDGMCAYNDR
jgi:multimeric flavodoxin WrbA